MKTVLLLAASVTLYDHGKPVLTYVEEPKLANNAPERTRRCCYIYPLYAPNGVNPLDDFPKDHWHHRGLFWAWPRVIVDGKEYDIWIPKGIRERSTKVETTADTLTAQSEWLVDEKPVVKLTTTIDVLPSAANVRKLEFHQTLEAVKLPVQIGGTHEGNKGYGGLGMRFAPRENTVIRTDKGVEEKDTDLVPHPWAELEADYQGRSTAVRIDIAPNSAGYPNGWCLRKYGFLGVDFPGLDPITLEPGKPVRLHYTITLTSK